MEVEFKYERATYCFLAPFTMTIDEFAFKGCLETALNLGLIVCGINIVTLDLINLEVDSVQSKVLYL